MTGEIDVLVVDDNPGDRKFIKESLQSSQLEVTVHTVTTKDEALDIVSHRRGSKEPPRPDVVFIDWSLSYETSEEVVGTAKSGNPPTLVAVMTGANPELSDMESTAPQADMYVQKPTEPEGYIELLRSVLSGQ